MCMHSLASIDAAKTFEFRTSQALLGVSMGEVRSINAHQGQCSRSYLSSMLPAYLKYEV